jgi:hypothetical protein
MAYIIFNLSWWNVSKIVSENARNQPLEVEAKKYENVLDKDPQVPRKVLSFAIPHHRVGSLFLGPHLQIRKFFLKISWKALNTL